MHRQLAFAPALLAGALGCGHPAADRSPSRRTPTDEAAVPAQAVSSPAAPPVAPALEYKTIKDGVRWAKANAADGRSRWVYLPPDDRPAFPLVLIAPAGPDALSGMELSTSDRDEHLPWALAGFAVVAYPLQGAIPGGSLDDGAAAAGARTAFRTGRAGVSDAAAALDWALDQLPVDPSVVVTVGHSAAGGVALRAANRDPRVRAAVLFAPALDLDSPNAAAIIREMEAVSPGYQGFIADASPGRHPQRLRAPLFLFHAADDSVVRAAASADFVSRLADTAVGLHVVAERGGHYDAMIALGIPRAIDWVTACSGARWAGAACGTFAR